MSLPPEVAARITEEEITRIGRIITHLSAMEGCTKEKKDASLLKEMEEVLTQAQWATTISLTMKDPLFLYSFLIAYKERFFKLAEGFKIV